MYQVVIMFLMADVQIIGGVYLTFGANAAGQTAIVLGAITYISSIIRKLG